MSVESKKCNEITGPNCTRNLYHIYKSIYVHDHKRKLDAYAIEVYMLLHSLFFTGETCTKRIKLMHIITASFICIFFIRIRRKIHR